MPREVSFVMSRSALPRSLGPRRLLARNIVALLVGAVSLALCASQSRAAERLWYFDASGETLRNRAGTVVSYREGQWEFDVDGGGTLRLPTSRVVALDFESSESWTRGLREFQEGRWESAYTDLIQAYRDEPREWAKLEIQAVIVRCAVATGRDEIACRAFQELLDTDPQTRHQGLVPLAWTRGVASAQWQATAEGWMRSDVEWDRLLGASWLLQSPLKEPARGVLIDLTNSRDKAVRFLATMQLNRDELLTANAAQLTQWRTLIEEAPAEFRTGPRALAAQVAARLEPGDDAALAFPRTALDQPSHELWIAEGLLGAARQLAANSPQEARAILDELLRRFPESDAAQLGRNLNLKTE